MILVYELLCKLLDFFSGWEKPTIFHLSLCYTCGQEFLTEWGHFCSLEFHMSPNMKGITAAQALGAHGKAKALHPNSTVELVGEEPYYQINVRNATGRHDTQFTAIDGVPCSYGRVML